MATKAKKKAPDILDEPLRKTDWQKMVVQVKQNPLLYGAVAVFLVLCVLIGIGYRLGTESSGRTSMTQLARALDANDAAQRAKDLASIVKGKDPLSAEALYMMGEAAYEAKEYDKAKEAFERLRNEFPNSPFVPDAIEGLGFIAENAGDCQTAVSLYKEVAEKWRGTFTQRRQSLNIGRCEERLGHVEEAAAAYKAQEEDFPASSFDKEAKEALDRLRSANPDLFATKPAEAPKPEAPAPQSENTASASPVETAPNAPGPESPAAPPESTGPAPAATSAVPKPSSQSAATPLENEKATQQ